MIIEGGGVQHYIQTNGTISWFDGSQADFAGAFPLSKQDRWTHVVMTSTAASPYVKCYVDGVEKTAGGVANGIGINASFTVFARAATTAGFHKGFCANMAIFDDALSSAEVTELFNQGIGYDLRNDTGDYTSSADLLNYWLFDDLTSVVDRKGSDNLTNPTSTAFSEMASFPENASGSTIVGDFSMKRKGVSILNINNDQGYAYALGQDKPSYFPKAGATGYSMSVAHRPIKTGITEIFWGNDITIGTTPTNDQFILFMNPNGSYQWQLGDGSSRPPAVSAAGVADGEWHIITLTIDYSVSPARWTIYADGIQSTTGTASISGPPGNFYDVSFGRWLSGGYIGSSASGCYRFYDVALSADEVERLAFSDLRLIKGLNNE